MMLWTIAIATQAHREEKFLQLAHHLLLQALHQPVEVVALRNYGKRTIAEYRQALLDDVRGRYVSYVDDDDWVADSYVSEIVPLLHEDFDVVGFGQEITGLPGTRGSLSVDHWEAPWPPVRLGGQLTYLRYVNHLTPVRTTIARQAGFGSGLDYGEDRAYSQALHPLLAGARSAYIDRPLYVYRWSWADTSATSKDGLLGVPAVVIQRRRKQRPLPLVYHPCFRWHPWSYS